MNYFSLPGLDVPQATPPSVLSPDDVENIVLHHTGMSQATIRYPTRRHPLVVFRQISMYFIRKHTRLTYQSIAEMYGLNTHVSPRNAWLVVQNIIECKDKKYMPYINFIETDIKKHIEYEPTH